MMPTKATEINISPFMGTNFTDGPGDILGKCLGCLPHAGNARSPNGHFNLWYTTNDAII